MCVGACSGGPGASHTPHPLSDPLPGLVPKALGCSDASFGSKIAQDLCRPLLSRSLSFLPAEFPCNAPPLPTARIEWGLGAAAMGSCSPQEPGKLGKNGENDEPKLNPLQGCKGRDYQGHREWKREIGTPIPAKDGTQVKIFCWQVRNREEMMQGEGDAVTEEAALCSGRF